MNIKEQIIEYTPEMIQQIDRLVRHNSVLGEAKPGMPFGEGPSAVLKEALEIAEELGFKTVNLDNYCGYVEIGEGDELIGIAGHLDIVPVGDGWNYDPLKVTVDGDKVYGRGTTDDKGPVIMALYAMKMLKDSGVKLNKRVRLIMGCNEETGSRCMRHYMEVAEPLTMGFTPDANFPCIYGEKGAVALLVRSKNTKIISMKGGFVANAVCHQCTTVIPSGIISIEALEHALAATPLVKYSITEEADQITIYAEGIAAHASMPLLGINAAGCTFAALEDAGFEDDFVSYYNEHIGMDCDGAGLGIKMQDDYGDLTSCNGMVYMEDGHIVCTIDNRVPVTVDETTFRNAIAPYLDDPAATVEITHTSRSLFYPRESKLVDALYSAYSEVSGDTVNEPMVIGGGTYAKALPGIIAFGPELPDMDYHIHNADEFTTISDIQNSTEIYYKAIENMLAI